MKPVVTVSGIEDLASAIARRLTELRASATPPTPSAGTDAPATPPATSAAADS